MPALLIRLNVTDIAIWRRVFDELEDVLNAHGCLGSQRFRNADHPNETFILLAWDDLERARLFAQSDDLREAMRRGGVANEPDLWFLNDAGRTPG
jgi:heme-degrading monooxygenase HmoA